MEKKNTHAAELLVLLPSMRISGGVQEVLRLAAAVTERGVRVKILVLWKHPHESPNLGLPIEYLSNFEPRKSSACWQFWTLLWRFYWYVYSWRQSQHGFLSLMLTHYSTFPFAWLAPKIVQRICFNQDLEWLFVPVGLRRAAVRWLILLNNRHSRVITSNHFISRQYAMLGINQFAQASTWAEPFWSTSELRHERSIDVVMLLRNGTVKRLDLYLELIHRLQDYTTFKCAVITPEKNIYEQIQGQAQTILLRPSNEEIKELFGNSKIFVLLSDIEGFGLPPVEAMGSGCIPLCRDSGGVRNYLQGPLAANLIPLQETVAEILKRLEHMLARPDVLISLSSSSYQAFQQGLRETRDERERCFDHLAQCVLDRSGSF